MKHWPYFLISMLCMLSACQMQSVPPELDDAFSKAGDNRAQLFKVLHHYNTDSLKRKAASFLIANMTDRVYFTGKVVDEYESFLDSVFQIVQNEYDAPTIYNAFRFKSKFLNEKPVLQYDIKTLSADYLIKSIDEAFALWAKPWNQHLDFNDFCEYILPYRINAEIPELWRSAYQNEFAPFLPESTSTAKEACISVNTELIRRRNRFGAGRVLPISLRPSTLLHIKFGLCSDYATQTIFVMRSLGIPVALDVIPHWGTYNMGHTFGAVIDNDGTTHDFSGSEDNPDSHLIRFCKEIPKIYRETFGVQKESLAMIHGTESIPPEFRNPCIKDVTGEYSVVNSKEVVIDIPIECPNQFIYLCVFDPKGWTPIDWAKYSDNKARFKHVGTNIVYQTAVYLRDTVRPVGAPFFLDTLGIAHPYIPSKETERVIVERKYPEPTTFSFIRPELVGSRFQGANDGEFKDAITLYTLTEEPDYKYKTINVQSNKPVKYVRYQSSSHTTGNMSEVEFYSADSDDPLKGKVVSGYVPSPYFPNNGPEYVFDGDPLTFFHSADSLSWAGLELDYPTKITRIRYLIRNDDNGIRKGHEYELFYNENGTWRTCGKHVASNDDIMTFDYVPKGALLWLRDYTRGVEERIFEFKDKQVFWH